ncbi:hypothetical protein [Allocoleopsis sp.]
MKPLKFPLTSTLALFAIAGLLAFCMPFPYTTGTSSSVISKIFR